MQISFFLNQSILPVFAVLVLCLLLGFLLASAARAFSDFAGLGIAVIKAFTRDSSGPPPRKARSKALSIAGMVFALCLCIGALVLGQFGLPWFGSALAAIGGLYMPAATMDVFE